MKAAFYDLEPSQVERVSEFAKMHALELAYCGGDPCASETVDRAKNVEILSTFMCSDLGHPILEKIPQLRLIATRSTGFDHINLDYARGHRIAVVNVPAYGEETVAEYAMGLLLALARKIHLSHRQSRQGHFSQSDVRGVDLSGKTMGVIGTGRIGRNFVRMAAAGFQMKVLAYDPFPNEEIMGKYGVRYVELEPLLRQSDMISIHIPNLPSTRHLINRKNISLLKPGVILVNTARGPVVESEALLEGMQRHIFGGLGLDTFEGEEPWIQIENVATGTMHFRETELRNALLSFHLQQYPNVILTPHNAFNSQEAVDRILETSLENVSHFLAGRLQNGIPGL